MEKQRDRKTELEKYEQYMLESNRIEGEDRVNPRDVEAVIYVVKQGIHDLKDLTVLHGIIGEYLKEDWVGRFRDCDVSVGNQKCPRHFAINRLMKKYIKNFLNMDSWTAHNEFEMIHPFQDLNGRMGRLIWLHKAIDEGYSFRIPFLQAYYYQTLTRFNKI